MDSAVPGVLCLLAIGIVFVIPMWAYTLVTERTLRILRKNAIEAGRNEPVTIQPYVNLGVCMGSGACVPACPEDVLKVLERQAVAVNMSACIGHGACVSACPVGAIELVFGSAKRGIDIPQVGPDFQTNVPGVFIAGELGGMGLIANAAEQGHKAVGHALTGVKRSAGADVVDLMIVGAGPAGLAAAAHAKSKGASYVLVDQDALGGAVRHYPRKKLVFTRPMTIQGYPPVNLKSLRKEELVDLFEDVVKTVGIQVNSHERVDKIDRRPDGFFSVTTAARTVAAQRVILALGRRGTPRKLGCSGEDLEKVAYSLLEPEQYTYEHILVVGGGDSALEAATVLSEQPGNRVTLSYRGEKINRPKEKNIQILRDAMKAGQLEVLLESEVKELTKDRVVLEQRGEEVVLANDTVFVMVGGVLPTKFLKSTGIQIDKHYGKRIEADDGEEKPKDKAEKKERKSKDVVVKPRAPSLSPEESTSLRLPRVLAPGGHDEPTLRLPDAPDGPSDADFDALVQASGLAPAGFDEVTVLRPSAGSSSEPTVELDVVPDDDGLDAVAGRIRDLVASADALAASDPEGAEALLSDAMTDATRFGLPIEAALVWRGLAGCAEARGHAGEARVRLAEALAALGDVDCDDVRVPILLAAAALDSVFGRFADALNLLDLADGVAIGVHGAHALVLRAEIAFALGDADTAHAAVEAAENLLEPLPSDPVRSQLVLTAARVLLDLDRVGDAARLLARPGDAGDSGVHDPVGQLLVVRARIASVNEPAVARGLCTAALARPAPASFVAAARIALDAAKARIAAGAKLEGREAAKRALKTLRGTGIRGLQVEALRLIVGLGADPAVAASLASSVAAITADLPPALGRSFSARFGLPTTGDGSLRDFETEELTR